MDESPRGSGPGALRPVQVAGVIGAGCRSVRARKRRTMKASVAPCCSCRRRGGAGLTDKTSQTDRGRGGQCRGERRWRWDFKQRIGPWVQRDAFLSGMEEVGRARKMGGTERKKKERASKSTVVFLAGGCLHRAHFCSKPLCSSYISVHIDVNLPLCMDLYR